MLQLLISAPQLGTKPQWGKTAQPRPCTGTRNELSSLWQVFSAVLPSCDQILAWCEGSSGAELPGEGQSLHCEQLSWLKLLKTVGSHEGVPCLCCGEGKILLQVVVKGLR